MKLKKLPTLLLITADPLVRVFFEDIINEMEENALITASSRLESLDFLGKTYISAVVIDEATPQLDLIPFLREIRSLDEYAHIPLLVITSHLKKSFIRSLIKAGATDFLQQPLDRDECLLRMEMAEEAARTKAKMSTLSSRLSKSPAATASLEHKTILDDRAPRLVGQALSEKKELALLLLEMDQYREIRKARGENISHALTLDFEDHLHKLMRTQDLLYNQNHGKYAIFLPKTSCKAAFFIAENIQEYLDAEVFSAGSIRFTVTVSIGIASLSQAGDEGKSAAANLERLLQSATVALSKALEKKNTIATHPSK